MQIECDQQIRYRPGLVYEKAEKFTVNICNNKEISPLQVFLSKSCEFFQKKTKTNYRTTVLVAALVNYRKILYYVLSSTTRTLTLS